MMYKLTDDVVRIEGIFISEGARGWKKYLVWRGAGKIPEPA